MNLKRTEKYKLYPIVLMFTIFVFNNHAHGWMHCQSEDGHSAIEFVGSGCCDAFYRSLSPDDSTVFFEETFSTSRNLCGPCVDMIIAVDVLNTDRKTVVLNPTFVTVPGFLNVTAGCYKGSGHAFVSKLSASVNPSLSSIRTIVFLA